MSYSLELQDEAIIDIRRAFAWYEEKSVGLGYELIGEIEEGFERLSKHPQHYIAINHRYRRLKIKRFPFLIIYELEASKVIVNAVVNISQELKI